MKANDMVCVLIEFNSDLRCTKSSKFAPNKRCNDATVPKWVWLRP